MLQQEHNMPGTLPHFDRRRRALVGVMSLFPGHHQTIPRQVNAGNPLEFCCSKRRTMTPRHDPSSTPGPAGLASL